MSESVPSLDKLANLVQQIQQTHAELTAQAGKAVNVSLTLRNWLIGFYIAEYEQQGKDRAQYGAKLLGRLANELERLKIPRSDQRELRRYRLFYQTYPQIRESLTPELTRRIPLLANLGGADSQIAPQSTNCLLYTSPSPRDLSTSRMPSSA